ncbi:MAG: RagB/SusD family nutrient uptake outer membrane protein, partial [Muribaculaceae bacterium]|nr:RagB/SusD family nutrient uptake outer membrane protein [Muribaculaceae bacterium]
SWARRCVYATAANEAFGPDHRVKGMTAVDAVNAVRARVGMPGLPAGMTKDEFRTRVRNERRVELAYEGHRFYDVRRWKILDKTDRVVTGMKVNKDDAGNETFERFVVSRRNAYTDKWLLLPVPGNEVARLFTQTGVNFQNPGWN